ncbi:MAG: hypothetical protein M5U25_18405 [Planctomycetota bacterium]|nr:hypothetical protein [Planctomycetota bacterium]
MLLLMGVAALTQCIALAQPITTYPYTEDFETATGTTLPTGWAQLTAPDDTRNWTADSGGTSSLNTGPSVDHNPGTAGGIYIYYETSGPSAGEVCIAQSPQFDWSSLSAPLVEFWYHMYGATMGTMHLDLDEQFNSGTDGDNTGTTFTAASANFTAAHVGSQIVLTGGNAGSYTIASVTNATTVELATAPASNLTGQTYTHRLLTLNVVASWTNNQDQWLPRSVPLLSSLIGGGNEQLFRVRIRGLCGTSFTSDMAFDDFTVRDNSDDVGPTALTAPVSGSSLGSAETVTISVTNFGVVSQSNFDVSYSINGGAAVVETFTASLAAGATLPFTFATTADLSAEGSYTFVISTALTGDQNSANDSLTVNVFHTFATFPYVEDFEAGNGGWTTSGTSSWALGTPANTIINSAASGTNAWVTNLTGLYNTNEQGAVVSPGFDFTGFSTDPWVSLRVWWNCEFSWDGMNLQSSIDNGTSWQLVGAFGDPNNWYTDNTITGNPGGSQQGWSGRNSTANGSGGWVIALHELTGLAGQSSVLFRVNFGSDGSINDEGVAFDLFEIGELQEMEVLRGATPVADGGTDSGVNISTTGSNLTYTIQNTGDFELNLTGTPLVSVTAGTNVTSVNVTTSPSTPVAGAGSTQFIINVVPTAAGAYDFTGSINNDDPDENPYNFTVSGNAVSNVPPAVTLGAGNWVDAGGGLFTLTLNPGATINDTLNVDDPTPNDMTVDVITAAALTGITGQPANITTPTAGTINLTWTGTADASNTPGNYNWTIDINDGTSTTSITARIIIVDVPPQHTILNASGGDGSAGTPYTYTFAVGNTGANSVDLATVTDANTSQTVTISGTPNQTSGPTGGTGFQFTLAANALTVAPAGALVAADVGTQVFEVVVSDGNVANDQTITVSSTWWPTSRRP